MNSVVVVVGYNISVFVVNRGKNYHHHHHMKQKFLHGA